MKYMYKYIIQKRGRILYVTLLESSEDETLFRVLGIAPNFFLVMLKT